MKVVRRKTSMIDLYNDRFKAQEEYLSYLQDGIIKQVINNQEKFIEDILRNHVIPPIKGEITKGKIKWRGLTIHNDIGYSKLWISQRGVKIPIIFDYSLNLESF